MTQQSVRERAKRVSVRDRAKRTSEASELTRERSKHVSTKYYCNVGKKNRQNLTFFKIFFLISFLAVGFSTAFAQGLSTTTEAIADSPAPLDLAPVDLRPLQPLNRVAAAADEIVGLRTENSRTFKVGDVYHLRLYGQPIFRPVADWRDRFSVYAATTSTAPGDDSKIRNGTSADTNFGSDSDVQVGYWSTDKIRLVFQYVLPADPGSATITGLTLHAYRSGGGGGFDVSAHKLITLFNEGTVTWNTPWTVAGGDYLGTVLDTETIPSSSAEWHVWDVSTVTTTWNGTLGLILIGSNEGGSESYATFKDKEETGTANDPYLEITYTLGGGATTTATTTTATSTSATDSSYSFIWFFAILCFVGGFCVFWSKI